MKQELYEWMKNLAMFYLLFTAVLHLIPDSRYERYVRSFLGLLLILMLCTPLCALLRKSGELTEIFGEHYRIETGILEEQEMANLQELYLHKGYENEMRQKVLEALKNTGIKVRDAAVHIEGESMAVTLCLEEELTAEQERRVNDALGTACQIGEGEYQIQIVKDDTAAVGSAPAFGTASGSGSTSGIP